MEPTLNISKNSNYGLKDRNRKAFVSMSVSSVPYQTIDSTIQEDKILSHERLLSIKTLSRFDNVKINKQLLRSDKA